MVLRILAVLALSALAGIAYRMGGSGRFNRLWRICGVPGLTILAVWACFGVRLGFWWAYLISFGAMAGAISSYWDEVFGFDNFWFHGFAVGAALAPIAFITGHWWLYAIRCVVLAVFMGVWCLIFSDDVTEEVGRGVSIPATVLLMLL